MATVIAAAVHVLVALAAAPVLGLLLRSAIRQRHVLAAAATALLVLSTATSAPPRGFEATYTAAFVAALALLLSTYPDGRFVPGWTAWPVGVVCCLAVAYAATGGRVPGWGFVASAELLLLGAQIYRYRRRSSVEERARTRWPVLAMMVTVTGFGVVFVADGGRIGGGGDAMTAVTDLLGTLPAYGFAIGLIAPMWGKVDAAIRGFLAVLGTGMVLAVTYGAASALARAAGADVTAAGWWGGVAVAVFAAPVLRLAGRTADRIVYRGRPDPMRALTELGRRLDGSVDPLAVPHTVVRTARTSLHLDGVELRADGVLAAVDGVVRSGAETFPIDYQGERLGVLAAAPRAGESGLTAHDRRVLAHLARQSGSALHGTRAFAELALARSRLVLAREDERRRLRRDLHDDLAPTLAGLGLGAAAIEQLAREAGGDVSTVAADLRAGIRAATRQVREIAYDLRPPVLDDLGLVAAIRDRVSGTPASVPSITVDAPDELELPAAVESAALRIVQEAVANVRRHAAAANCAIRLWRTDGDLTVEIVDDGLGLPPDMRTGVGLRSIAERAAELGGEATITTGHSGGVRVLARLPASWERP